MDKNLEKITLDSLPSGDELDEMKEEIEHDLYYGKPEDRRVSSSEGVSDYVSVLSFCFPPAGIYFFFKYRKSAPHQANQIFHDSLVGFLIIFIVGFLVVLIAALP